MREAMGEVLAEREREKEEERETKGRDASSVRRDPSRSKADQGLKAPKGYSVELERGNPAVAESMSISSDPNAANLSIISPLQAHIHRAVSSATDKVLACV